MGVCKAVIFGYWIVEYFGGNLLRERAASASPPRLAFLKPESPKLEPVQASYETGMPIEWIKIHHVADYAYFSHQAHVNRGVGCVSCHGRIDQMEEVYQSKPMSMGWCGSC